MKQQPWQISVEFAFSDARQKIAATRCTKFSDIKQMICQKSCGDPAKMILWWMGEEMRDEMTLGDAFSWRAAVETTLHCEERADRDRGLKRSRSSRSPCL